MAQKPTLAAADEPSPSPLTTDEEALLRAAGAGFLSDLAKMAYNDGRPLELDVNACTDTGAGFVQDAFRARRADVVTPEEAYTAAIENLSNQNPAVVKVSAADFPHFPTNTLLDFNGTGYAELDSPVGRPPYVITSVNSVGKTFKIDLDARRAPASVTQGTVTTLPQPAAQMAFPLAQTDVKAELVEK